MRQNLRKAARDLGVLLAATALWWLGENVASLGLPEQVAPLVGAVALLGYRSLRGQLASAPTS